MSTTDFYKIVFIGTTHSGQTFCHNQFLLSWLRFFFLSLKESIFET